MLDTAVAHQISAELLGILTQVGPILFEQTGHRLILEEAAALLLTVCRHVRI